MLKIHEQINMAWLEGHECIGNSFPVPWKATVRNWKAVTVCPCADELETGLVNHWVKSSVQPSSYVQVTEYTAKSRENMRKMFLHQTIPVKSLSQQLVEKHIKPSTPSQAGSITSTDLLHGKRAKERKWPNQKQEGVKAGTKWWFTSLASEIRKWSSPRYFFSQNITSVLLSFAEAARHNLFVSLPVLSSHFPADPNYRACFQETQTGGGHECYSWVTRAAKIYKQHRRSKCNPSALPLVCHMILAKSLYPGFPSFYFTHDSAINILNSVIMETPEKLESLT